MSLVLSSPAALPQRFPRHIAIEGAIGVGKSSLARRLAERLGARVFLERPQDNPYLERFYQAGTENLHANTYALPTQLFFLFQRLEQMREMVQPGMFDGPLVSDFLFAKDALFARLTLADEDYLLYMQIFRRYEAQVPQPDLVVWLRAGVSTLQQRIERRALPMEHNIAPNYLARLSQAYVQLFAEMPQLNVLAVDTEGFNPVDREADFEAFVERLARFKGPRERWGAAELV